MDSAVERGRSFLDDLTQGGADWPRPQPLAVRVAPEPYPLDALPATIRAAVEEVAGFVKAPLPLVASSALAALSLAIQAHVDVRRADKLAGPAGVFLLTIADSGERKSTCDGFFTQAIRDYEEAQAEAAKSLLKDYKAASDAWEAKRSGIKDQIRRLAKDGKPTSSQEATLRDLEHDKPEPPRVPRLIYGDATPEALAFALAKQWPSAGVVSAEAGIVFGAHGMGKDSVMRNLALLNVLWDGGKLTIDRRSVESFIVRGARLTMALQVQEATLRDFFDRSGALARGTGFLARFLVAWPESTQGLRPFTEAPASWPALAAFNRRLAEILAQPAPVDDEGALSPLVLPLTPEAKVAWVAFHDTIESELASGGELYDVRDVASKSADNAARLAALFQVFEDSGNAVGVAAFDCASRIAAWHLNEARRFFGELALSAALANAARLDAWLIGHCRREHTHAVPTRTVQQFGPGGLRDKTAMDAALHELEEAGRVRVDKTERRRVIKVNPALVIGEGKA
jgi:putative DNA primase/helicase